MRHNQCPPIYLNAYTGSGTEMFISEFRLKMHVSHMAHLGMIVQCAGWGILTYPLLFDFTAGEAPPQAEAARANTPG